MSIRLMSLVWDTDLPQTEKLVMLALADWSNDDGVSWPQQSTIARRCSLSSDRHVRRLIGSLVDRGLLEKVNRGRAGVTYKILIEALENTGRTCPDKCEKKPDTHVRLNNEIPDAHVRLYESFNRTPTSVLPDTHVRSINRTTKNRQVLPADKSPTPPKSISKVKTISEHAWFTKWWCHVFELVTGTGYAYTRKSAGQIKQLIDQIGLDELVPRACAFITLPESQRFPKGAPTLEGLQLMINQIADAVTPEVGDKCLAMGIIPADNTPLIDFHPWQQSTEQQGVAR